MASSAHLWRSVDFLQPDYCSWMGFAGSASPSLWQEIFWMEFQRAQDPLYQAPETGTYILPECPVNCDIGARGFDNSRAIHIAS